MPSNRSYIPAVREQYEHYPYPPRDPADERHRLILTEINDINRVNFYCFGGRQKFENFSVLDAGGGTGDSTIQWAERLRNTNSEVVYLDISEASAQIAKRRAEVRGLNNIRWLKGSIHDLPRLDVGPFDFIVCTGVLHHLEDPKAGLLALLEKLKPEGSLGLMLYAKYGRASIYQIQELMRLVNRDTTDPATRINNTKKMLAGLPPGHAFRQNERYYGDYLTLGDAGIYDLFLHARDRPYTIAEIHELLDDCGLHLTEFSTPRYRLLYRPETVIQDRALLERILSFPLPIQQHIAEIIVGLMGTHEFYTSRRTNTIAHITDVTNVPYFYPARTSEAGKDIARRMITGGAVPITARHPNGFQFELNPDPVAGHVVLRVDGEKTLAQIFQAIRREEPSFAAKSDEELVAAFAPVFERFRMLDWLLLRHSSVTKFNDLDALQSSSG